MGKARNKPRGGTTTPPAKRAPSRKKPAPPKKPASRNKAPSRTPTKKAVASKAKRVRPKTRAIAAGVHPGPTFRAAAAPVLLAGAAQALTLDIVTFNTHGAIDKSGAVQNAVGPFLRAQRPAIACFQELFFEGERLQLDAQLLGPDVVREVTGDIEIARTNDGTYSTRIGTTPTGAFGGAGAGIAIYTSLLVENPRFIRFDSLAFPDSLAVKGIVGVDVITEDSSFVLATTHFNDDENDQVDGRARRSNIANIAQFLATAVGRPVIIVGDFNLNSSATSGVDAALFKELNVMGGRVWLEAGLDNARQNGLARPVPTLVGGQRSIDFMFASGVAGLVPRLAADTYVARDPFASDHKLVRATLELA